MPDNNFRHSLRFTTAVMCPIIVVITLTGAGPQLADSPTPKVEAILKMKFSRAIGPETGGAAVYPDSKSNWFDQSVGTPTTDFDGRTYRMWFVGTNITDDPTIPYGFAERIGLATSSDGIHWTVANDRKPVLDFATDGKFDDAGLSHPFVLRVNGQFMMWYGGIDGRAGKDVGVGPAHVRIEQIGLATSEDGIHWKRANGGEPVLRIGPKGSIDAVQATGCHIIHQAGQFIMWYGAYNGTHTIGLATSQDGIHWKKKNGGRSLPGLSGREQLGPSVYFDGNNYLMFYNTILKTSNGGNLWTLFTATSGDGVHWKPALENEPLLGPAPPGYFGSADGLTGNNQAVHPTAMLFLNNQVHVWCGAEGNKAPPGRRYAPSAIGLMVAKHSGQP